MIAARDYISEVSTLYSAGDSTEYTYRTAFEQKLLKGTFGAIVDFMNTFDLGQVRVLVYRDEAEDVWYASALELNLTIDGTDKNAVFLELNHAIAEYHRSAEEIGDVALLNQTPDPELVALWDACIQNTPIVSPYTSYFAGRESLQYA